RRLLDTRASTTPYEGRLGNEQIIELPVQSLAGMPDAVWAVAANLTVVGADTPGFVAAFPCTDAIPTTSSLNFAADGPVAALSMAPVSAEGTLCIFSKSRGHLIVDLVGVWVHDQSLIPPEPGDMTNPGDDGDPGGPIDPPMDMDPMEALDMPDVEDM